MGKFDGVLLVSDFDDTLYDSHCQVPRRNLEALDRFLAQGGRFTVATGRAHRTFAPYVHLAPVNAPVVLSNGSAIYDFQKDEFLVQTYLSPSAPQDLDGVMEAFPQLGMEAYHGEDIYVFRPNWITDLHMKKVGTDYTVWSHSGDAYALDQSHPPAGPRGAEGGAELASEALPPPV